MSDTQPTETESASTDKHSKRLTQLEEEVNQLTAQIQEPESSSVSATRRQTLAGLIGGGALLSAAGSASAQSGSGDGGSDNAPFAHEDHDHSGEYGTSNRLGVKTPVESIVAQRVHTREIPHADVTAYGAKGDGETDDTAAIQSAIDAVGESDELSTVFFPAGTYMVDPTTLDPVGNLSGALELHSDMELLLTENATIKNLPHDTSTYQILRLYGVENVKITGGTIDGAREDNAADGGQWGHCIYIAHSENVTVRDTTVKNGWGDGIYVGGRESSRADGFRLTNRNIHLTRIHADSNRRQGISLVSAKEFWLTDSLLENTSGTYPAAGLDIETHRSSEIVDNIHVSNLETANNRIGIQIWLNGYKQPNPENEVKISIDNHHDHGSRFGMRAGTPVQNIPGEVRVSNSRWEKSGKRAFSIPHWNTLPLILDNPTAIDTLGSEAFYFQLWSHRDMPGGNIEVNRPKVTTGEEEAKPEIAIWHRHAADYTNFTLRNPRELAATDAKVSWNPDATIEDFTLVDDANEVLRGSPDEDQRVKGWNTLSTVDSREFTADRELYLPGDRAPHGDYIFESHSGEHQMIVVPPSDEAIYPISGSAGTSIESGGAGARLRLRKVATGKWMVINQVGAWHEGEEVSHPDG